MPLLTRSLIVRPAPDLTRSVGVRVAAVAPGPQLPPVAGGEAAVEADAMDTEPIEEDAPQALEIELDEAVPLPGDGGRAGDSGEPAARRRRVTRKVTASIFFEHNLYACKVSCLANDTV